MLSRTRVVVVETFVSAARTVAGVVDRIPPHAWDGPGLGVWDLRALVGHTSRALVTTVDYLARPAAAEEVSSPARYYALVAAAGDPAGVAKRRVAQRRVAQRGVAQRGRRAGEALGPDPAEAFRELVERATAAVGAASPDALLTTPAGGMRLAAYLPTRTFELVVHGLDVARILGVEVAMGGAVLDEAAALAARIAVARGEGPLLLAGLTGRRELPAGYTVVG